MRENNLSRSLFPLDPPWGLRANGLNDISFFIFVSKKMWVMVSQGERGFGIIV
jgi:hypothetical protein